VIVCLADSGRPGGIAQTALKLPNVRCSTLDRSTSSAASPMSNLPDPTSSRTRGRMDLKGQGDIRVLGLECPYGARHDRVPEFRPCEVAISVVDGLELGAVDGHAGGVEQPHLATKSDELGADLTDGPAAVLAEVGDGLVVGSKATGEPHQLDIATGLAFQASARLHPIEIAVNVELEQNRRMVGRASGCFGLTPSKPSALRSSAATKASMTRTGLFSSTQSSRLLRNRVVWLRSTPSTKRLIGSPNIAERSYHRPRFDTPRNVCRRTLRSQGPHMIGTKDGRIDPTISAAVRLCTIGSFH
jgi:hypothetical protein